MSERLVPEGKHNPELRQAAGRALIKVQRWLHYGAAPFAWAEFEEVIDALEDLLWAVRYSRWETKPGCEQEQPAEDPSKQEPLL